MAVKAIPDGYHSVNTYLTLKGAAKALEFYKKAFGAVELARMPGPGDKLMHAEIRIGDSIVMMADEMLEMGGTSRSPATLGGTTCGVMLYVEDVDAAWKRAIDAGAKVLTPLDNMFWGDRYGKLADPFGHEWSLAQHVEDVSPEEMKKRMAAMKPPG